MSEVDFILLNNRFNWHVQLCAYMGKGGIWCSFAKWKEGKMKTLCFILCYFYENLTQPLWICHWAHAFQHRMRTMIRATLHSTLYTLHIAFIVHMCITASKHIERLHELFIICKFFEKFKSIRAFVSFVCWCIHSCCRSTRCVDYANRMTG